MSREEVGDGFAPPLPDDEQENAEDEKDELDKETPEEETARIYKAQAEAVQRWEADTPDPAEQQAIVDHIAETGEIPEGTKINQGQIDAIYDGYVRHIGESILSPLNLDYQTWADHVDVNEHPVLMGLALKGDWKTIHEHAARVKDQIRRHPEWYLD